MSTTRAAPLASFVLQYFGAAMDRPYVASAVFTAIAFFSTGALKSRFVQQSWLLAGVETLIVGGSAAALAYVVGAALAGLAS